MQESKIDITSVSPSIREAERIFQQIRDIAIAILTGKELNKGGFITAYPAILPGSFQTAPRNVDFTGISYPGGKVYNSFSC